MITPIFHTVDHKISKTVYEQVQESYEVEVEHTREVIKIKREQHTRKKKHGPQGCGICLRCGIKINPDDYKYLSEKAAYLCKKCWYSITYKERDEYRDKATRGYESTEIFFKDVPFKEIEYYIVKEQRIRKKTISKTIYVTDRVIKYEDNPPQIKYNTENEIKFHKLKINELLSEEMDYTSFYDKIKIEKEKDWFGAESVSHCLLSILEGEDYKHLNEGLFEGLELNDRSFTSEQRLEEFDDVIGFYPNVPAFIQGHPLNMYNNRRTNEFTATFYCNLAIDSRSNAYQYKNRGIIISNLIWYFIEHLSIKVNLALYDASFVNGETFVQYVPITYEEVLENKQIVYNILTQISFYRIMMLNQKMKLIDAGLLSKVWNVGHGYIMKHAALRKYLESVSEYVDADSVVFGDPIDLNIGGFKLKEDFLNAIRISHLQIENESPQPKEKIKLDADRLKQFLQVKGITRLIHFTHVDNLDSIKKYGILPMEELLNKHLNVKINDSRKLRGDNMPYVSLSVTDPDIAMLELLLERNPENKFVILEIDPEVLYKEKRGNNKLVNRKYSNMNALDPDAKISEHDMGIMFRKTVVRGNAIIERKKHAMNQTTCRNAEILYRGIILPKYIFKYYEFQPQ